MAMEFGKMTVSKAVMTAAEEGGAVVGGLFIGGTVGKLTENYVKPGIVVTSTTTDKVLAWSANNIPKMLAWVLLKKEGKGRLGGLEDDIAKGVLASIVLDSAVRAGNKGAPGGLKIFGIDVLGFPATTTNANTQTLINDNATLRSQLNTAMQKLASGNVPVNVRLAPPEPNSTKYSTMSQQDEVRRTAYGAMTSPAEAEQNRRYSTMNAPIVTQTLGEKYGML